MADDNTNQNQVQNPNDTMMTKGIVGLFHTISGTKTKIVYTNLFTGKIKVKSGGFFFNFPWRKQAVKISLDQQKVDTIEKKAFTLGGVTATGAVQVGPQVSYDTDYFIKVSNPEKFMDSAYSTSVSQILKNIGEILDQQIQDYIKSQQYDNLIAHSSVDFLNQIGSRTLTGSFPPNSLNQELLDNYGLEVTKLTFKVNPPKELVDEAIKTRQAEQAAKTAEEEQKKVEIIAQGQAKKTEIESIAAAEAEKKKGEALAANITSWISAGLDPAHVAKKLANHELVNGSNPHTVIIAAAEEAQRQLGGHGDAFNMTLMLQMFQQMLQQNQQGYQNQQGQPAQQQASTMDWSSVSDDEYLTAEDSAALAAERGKQIAPGARYHITLLTADEKTRYCVASAKGKTR